ncbi:MAG: TolB family protein [Acidobacteriota bacterium]
MDGDGSNPKQLTEGTGVESFALTPDGRGLVYSLYEPSIWKVSAEGGSPIKVADASAWTMGVSPDGSLLAYGGLNPHTKRLQLTVLRLDDLAPVKTFDLPVTARSLLGWSSDSLTLIYPDVRGGMSNLWRLPIDAAAPTQITNFKSDLIYYFAYSRDGKNLALSLGNTTRDAVLITEEK